MMAATVDRPEDATLAAAAAARRPGVGEPDARGAAAGRRHSHPIDAAAIDEAEVKASLRAARAEPAAVAEALAELKAQRVSRRHAGSW